MIRNNEGFGLRVSRLLVGFLQCGGKGCLGTEDP